MAEKRRDHKGRILRTGESQRKDLTYQYRYSDRLGRHAVYAKTLSELREKEAQIDANLSRNPNYHMGKATLYQLSKRYLSIKKNIAPSTKKRYENMLKHIERDPFGEIPIKDVKRSDAYEWVLTMSESGKSFYTINGILSIVRKAFDMAIDDETIHRNPFAFNLGDVLTCEKKERGFLTKKQQKTFLDFIQESKTYSKHYDVFLILLRTGMRVSELCGLTKDDVDFTERRIRIDHQLYYDSKGGYFIVRTKTESGKRYIPMDEQVCRAMRNVVEQREKHGREVSIDGYSNFLFTTYNNKPKNALLIDAYARNIVKKYNSLHPDSPLPTITPHILRHTFCTDMSNEGMSIKSLQYLMGHKNSKVTLDVYAHGSLEQAAEELYNITSRKKG